MRTNGTFVARSAVVLALAATTMSACAGGDGRTVMALVEAGPPEVAEVFTEPLAPQSTPVIPDGQVEDAWVETIPEVDRLVAELGTDRTGGTYVNETQEYLVITVTDADTERRVLEAGFHADRVVYSTDEMNAVTEALKEANHVNNTWWGPDVHRNQTVVSVGTSVSDADVAAIEAMIEPFGDAAAMERVVGEVTFGVGP